MRRAIFTPVHHDVVTGERWVTVGFNLEESYYKELERRIDGEQSEYLRKVVVKHLKRKPLSSAFPFSTYVQGERFRLLRFKLKDQDRRRLEQRARTCGVYLSVYLRGVVVKHLRRE
ncbi:MAG: hypothetical protein ACLFVX_07755 [Archaeoglobaceae archaeon]